VSQVQHDHIDLGDVGRIQVQRGVPVGAAGIFPRGLATPSRRSGPWNRSRRSIRCWCLSMSFLTTRAITTPDWCRNGLLDRGAGSSWWFPRLTRISQRSGATPIRRDPIRSCAKRFVAPDLSGLHTCHDAIVPTRRLPDVEQQRTLPAITFAG
jgi:hypothetical protein